MTGAPQTREQYSAHLPALHTLCNLGWHFLPKAECLALRGGTREVLMRPRLIEVLRSRRFDYKGRLYPLSPNAVDQIVREVATLAMGDGLLAANERMYAKLTLGVTVTEFMPDGKKHQPTIPIIAWDDRPGANVWEVTEEMVVLTTQGINHRTPDLVCFVNGIPLAVIEAKRPEASHADKAMITEGISQHLRNQRHDEIPTLFGYAQLLLSINQVDARYGTTHTPAKFWARWREEELTEDDFTTIKNRRLDLTAQRRLLDNKPARLQAYFESLWASTLLPTDQDRLLIALLAPHRLLDLVRGFVLFDRRAGKIVARPHQFFGIRALQNQLRRKNTDGSRRGGVVWHTTGSGKSFTMVFLTKALLLEPELSACRFLVVTDRVDLEDQLAKNFVTSGAFGSAVATQQEGERSKVSTGRDLAKRIGRGTERIVFTLVHKFNTAVRYGECHNRSADLIVLVDEGHRSHGGELHERMRHALPNAAYVAFTGTPLLKGDGTRSKFGAIVHAYSMQRAVSDETVAPLLYEERVPELTIDEAAVNRWFDKITVGLADAQRADLKRRFSKRGAVYGAANRIELVAWDIATHFSEHVKSLGMGLKGQVATDSKLDAIRYKRALDETGLVTSAVIISAPDTREGNTEVDESTMPEVQAWWKQHVLRPGMTPEAYERDMLLNYASDGSPDLLIVVDRLLTGFDEPRNTVLYIDKPLKGHTLIQAVARVNRLHDAKRHGLLVDYRGILKELDTAIRSYQDLEERTQGGFDIADLEGLYQPVSTEYKQLPALHERLWNFFAAVKNRQDLEQYRQLLVPKLLVDGEGQSFDERRKRRDDFYEALTQFGLCLQTALSSRGFFEDRSFPEPLIRSYKEDLRFFTSLRKIVREDALETVDYSVYEEQLRRLVDRQVIGQEVREPAGVYLVHELGKAVDPATWAEDKTRNETDLIRTRLRKTIEQELAQDPYAQKVFAELLKKAIAEAEALFDHPIKQYALFKAFEEQVQERATPGVPDKLANNAHAKAYFGAVRLSLGEEDYLALDQPAQANCVDLALEIDRVVRTAVAEHSLNLQDIESEIRKNLLPQLFSLMGLDKARAAIEQVVQIVRVGLSKT